MGARGTDWYTDLTDDGVQDFLDAQVAATDSVYATFAAQTRFPVVVHFNDGSLWVGGLSPEGHLVGAVTYSHHPD